MASAAQILANQQNSQLSTGPRTPKASSPPPAARPHWPNHRPARRRHGSLQRLPPPSLFRFCPRQLPRRTPRPNPLRCPMEARTRPFHRSQSHRPRPLSRRSRQHRRHRGSRPAQRHDRCLRLSQARKKTLRNLQRQQGRLQRALFLALHNLNSIQDTRRATVQTAFVPLTENLVEPETESPIGFVPPEPSAPLPDSCISDETDIQ